MTSPAACLIRGVRVSGRALGVDEVGWWSDGRPDMFLVVRGELAERRWWPLADVFIAPVQPSVAMSAMIAAALRRQCGGFGLVAVGSPGRRCLVLLRDGRQVVVELGTDQDVFGVAVLSYLALVVEVR